MAFTVFLSVISYLFVLIPNVESRIPFWEESTTARPTMTQEYYEKFKVIPSKEETAEKLIEDFLRIPVGNTAKRNVGSRVEDTVAILDASGSVGACEFKKGKMALKNLMMIKRPDIFTNYYAGVVYSTSATVKFNFLPALKAADRMDEFSYENGATNTASALTKAKELFFDPNAGGHFFARKMVFLLTDGLSNTDRHLTIPNAEYLKSFDVKIYVVGIGYFKSGINEIVKIASSPHTKHLFRVATVADFLDVVKLAVKKVDPDTYRVVGNIPPPC